MAGNVRIGEEGASLGSVVPGDRAMRGRPGTHTPQLKMRRCGVWVPVFAGTTSNGDLAAEFVRDVHPDDALEIGLDGEPERQRAACIEAAGPACDDPLDELVRLTPDPGDCLLARHAPKRLDLLTHRAAYARHRQVDARPELLSRELGRVDEEADRGAWARMPMHDVLADGQDRFFAVQRLADDAGEKPGSRFVRLARAHRDRGQANADA